jgi:glutamate synthase (NADPH/NADH) small chain
VVQRRLDVLAQEGIEFRCNTEIGKDISAQQLLDGFDAVVLCTGATKPRDLPIEGRNLQGVHFAMEFLIRTPRPCSTASEGPALSAAGKDVVVIGGGDTGTDCVGTSMRHGCKSLVQSRSCASAAGRAADNPWPEWPKVYKLDYGQEEAAAKFGGDPRCLRDHGEEISGNEQGQVKELVTVQIQWGEE